jgi:hypothetical protein
LHQVSPCQCAASARSRICIRVDGRCLFRAARLSYWQDGRCWRLVGLALAVITHSLLFLIWSEALTCIRSFILEGILTVVVAVLAYWIVQDDPSKAKFLTEREKRILYQALHENSAATVASAEENEHFKWKHVWAALKDWQTWFHCISYWGIVRRRVPLRPPTVIVMLTTRAGLRRLRSITLPPHHHQRTRLHRDDGANHDHSSVCGGHGLVYPGGLPGGPDRPKRFLCLCMLHRRCCGVPHRRGAGRFHSGLDLCRMLHCRLWSLPMFVTQRPRPLVLCVRVCVC